MTTNEENELVQYLARSFPSLHGLDATECWRRVESLGLFAASLWAAGPQGLAQRGVQLPREAFDALAPSAPAVAQARRGGVAFLARLRAALRQDPRFLSLLGTIAQLVARAAALPNPGAATSAALQVATPPAAAGAPRPATRELAGFEIVAQLGEGNMGKVWKARQKSLDRFVALKVLSPQLANDQDYVARFHREAKAAASLQHPNVVSVIDQGTDAALGVHFIAFELIDGPTLEEVARARSKLPEREALTIVRGLADALGAAGRAGIVHRDVKPDNVILTKEGVPKLVDLGLARKVDEGALSSSLGYVMGTPAYMSPEQALGIELDHRADLYSLGLVLSRLLTGRIAFDAESSTVMLMKHVEQDVPDPRLVEPSISEGAARIVLKLCARERDARYASGADVVRDIDLVLAPAATPGPDSGTFRALRGAVQAGGGVVPEDPPWTLELTPGAVPDASLAPPQTADPAEALLASLERSGDPEQMSQAIDRFEGLLAQGGPDSPSQARTEAALARAFLLRGDKASAEARANAALARDPRCRPALEVLARAGRGDADRCRLEAGLAHVRGALALGKVEQARRLADRLREALPAEPHPWLALAALARVAGNEPDFVDALRRAWALFPSKEKGDVTLGGLDGLVADVLVAQGRAVYRGDGSLLKATHEGLDDRSNLVAGALRTGIGVARVALERGGLTLFQQRRLHFAIARGLSGLRKYDAALDEIAKATQFNPSEAELQYFEAEKRFVNYMKHVLEQRPGGGSGPPVARYRCLGALSLLELARARLAVAGKERAARTFEIEKVGGTIAALATRSPAVQKEVRTAAERAGARDPFELLEPIERELAEIARERTAKESARPAEPAAGGFLGRLKGVANAAAAGVAGAAKEAQLLLRETQAKARHEAAVKRFAAQFAKDLSGASFGAELAPLARKAAAHAAAADFWWDEEGRARRDVERLTPLA